MAACNNDQNEIKQTDTDSLAVTGSIKDEDSALIFENNADAWLDLSLQNTGNTVWKKFRLIEFWYEDSMPAQPFKPDPEFYKNYAPLLKWSADSSYLLDIGSYGKVLVKGKNGKIEIRDGEVDTKASLIFPKSGTISELLFLGAGGTILDGRWITPTQFSLLTVSDAENAQKPDTLLWLIDAPEKFFRKYKRE